MTCVTVGNETVWKASILEWLMACGTGDPCQYRERVHPAARREDRKRVRCKDCSKILAAPPSARTDNHLGAAGRIAQLDFPE